MSSGGNACINCRRRKIRCDGERPKCAKCVRSKGFQDCEYPQDGPTTGQRLEAQIAQIEARIEELQNPTAVPPAIVLQNPYTAGPSARLPHSQISQARPSNPLSFSTGIPQIELEPLINNFLHHGSQFGFFLNVNRFQDAVIGRSGQRPTTFLLDVVHLWGVHLSGADRFTVHEPNYLSRALRSGIEALSGTHRHNTIIHAIQAEVLMAHYFFRNSRFLEGKYHVANSFSLAIGAGLHRIRSGDPESQNIARSGSTRLPPPRDVIEEAESINALWAVQALETCWAIADGSPSSILHAEPGARLDTPWPIDINAPGPLMLPASSIGTIVKFLANRPDNAVSLAALHAKATTLFTQAALLASKYSPNMTSEGLSQFFRSFNSLDTVIEGFKNTLPTVHLHPTRQMLLIYTLAHVATIQLHNPFVVDVEPSRVRVLDCARVVVTALVQLPLNDFVFIDPIMGTLLMATCQVFITELQRFRRHRPWNGHLRTEETALTSGIDMVLAAMNIFGARCPLMKLQLATMQQIYQTL